MSDPARKPRRSLVLLPFFLVGALAIGWTVYWFIAREKIEAGLEINAAALRDQGYKVAWSEAVVSGYPFRFEVTLKDAVITEPGGWGLAAPVLEAATAAYAPGVIALVAPERVVLSLPDGQSLEITGRVLRASIGGYDKTPPRVSIEGVELAVASRDRDTALFTTLERFQAHLRPAPENRGRVYLSVENAKVADSSLLGRIVGDRPVSVRVAGEVTEASSMRGAGWPGVVKSWSEAGGVLDLREGNLSAGNAVLDIKPTRMAADAKGHAGGALSLSLTKASAGLMALGAIGVIPDETAKAAGEWADKLGMDGGPALSATLIFRDGKTYIGPLPVGPAPRFY